MRNEQLHDRFSQIVPESVRNMSVCIAGAGMTGSWTALALARMVRVVNIFDFDTVEAENIGVQAYTELNIAQNKAEAVAHSTFGLPLIGFDTRLHYYNITDSGYDIIILCVDSISAREEITRSAQAAGTPHIIDTRVLGETAFIQAVALDDYEDFIQSLPRGDALTHAPCGAKGTAYAGMWVASQVCALVNMIGRNLPLPPAVTWHVGMNERLS